MRPGGNKVVGVVLALAAAWLMLTPMAAASVPYRGPGHEGTVPLGDGGLSLDIPGAAGDNRTFVGLAGLPVNTCDIVLDERGDYAATHVDWTPGADAARVWADLAALEAPYRVRAHWLTDLNDACTVEVDETGTTWHDPRGRPFREPAANVTRLFLDGHVGDTIRVPVTVTNNGTLPTDVTVALPLQQEGWRVVDGSPALGVRVDPLEKQAFHFDVAVPRSQKPVNNVAYIQLSDDHGWQQKVLVLFELRPARPPPETNQTAIDTPPEDEGLQPWQAPTQEAPMSPAAPLVALGAMMLALARRRQAPGQAQGHGSSSG